MVSDVKTVCGITRYHRLDINLVLRIRATSIHYLFRRLAVDTATGAFTPKFLAVVVKLFSMMRKVGQARGLKMENKMFVRMLRAG